ncbi:MAG: ABC transporter ATP-binding protein [Cyclobacteriaceae bacterium]|nr:ABC transporter ATP-binding protein [Cyclobacteriaceae bacterium]
MPEPAITLSNVSKSFFITHEKAERYTSLRDVIAQRAKSLFSFSSNKKEPSTTKEEFWALRDLNFEIQQGDRIGIIGRNGAGKSTLLKVLSRITEPSKGRIEITGRVASLLEVGTGFHPELTGRENIFLNGAILGMSRVEIRKKFDEIVAFAEVEQFLDTPVKRYSSGMYVRLAFAVAAHLEPEILIVDEVLAVGDSAFQKKCLGKMEDVSKNQGRTVLFVSHNMGVINQLCQKAILLEKGRLVQFDQTRKVIDQYMLNSNGMSNVYLADEKSQSKSIFFERIETVSGSGKNSENFQFDESIFIKALLSVEAFDQSAKISFTLQNTNGENLSTFVESLEDFYDGAKNVSILVKLPASVIAPNTYAFRLAIFTPSNVYDLVEMICPVTIEETGSKMAMYHGNSYGNFFMNHEIVK